MKGIAYSETGAVSVLSCSNALWKGIIDVESLLFVPEKYYHIVMTAGCLLVNW